jgi:flagellar basal body-associated protein FliL
MNKQTIYIGIGLVVVIVVALVATEKLNTWMNSRQLKAAADSAAAAEAAAAAPTV